MNEIQLLRNQLAVERRRVREVASACAAALAAPAPPNGAALQALGEACAEYLRCVTGWFDQRDERLGELYARLPAGDAGRRSLEALSPGGSGPAALGTIAAAAAGGAWAALAQSIDGEWDARRGAIEALLASNPRVADWRAIAGIDADSIRQERVLYARVCAALPAGVRLAVA